MSGEEIIYQGVLRDAETRTWGSPDFLVRSDVLARLFPGALAPREAAIRAADLPGGWHYRVIDSKFATLALLGGGELGNAGSAAAYKVQVFLYNRSLGRLQGYEPPESFILGRGWHQTVGGEETRVRNCMDRLAPVSQDLRLHRPRPACVPGGRGRGVATTDAPRGWRLDTRSPARSAKHHRDSQF